MGSIVDAPFHSLAKAVQHAREVLSLFDQSARNSVCP